MNHQVFNWTKEWALKSNIEHHALEIVDSTNNFAKNLKPNTNEFALVFTKHQTMGRGRKQNTWNSSEEFDNLYCSWSFHLNSPPQPISAPLIGLALYQSLKSTWTNLDWSLKAPNDIYLNGKKVAGILIENVSNASDYFFTIGIGLNLFNNPSDIKNSIHINEVIQVEKSFYQRFLDHLLVQLSEHIFLCLEQELSPEKQYDLLNALNLFPGLDELYTKVLADASLQSPSKNIHWSEL